MNAARIKLLLIEDCPADARLIELMLRESRALHVECRWVDNLTDGIERLRGGVFDVVLLDLGLPESIGLDTLKIVCRETRVPTLVVLSGLTDEEVALQALQAGAQDYLVKGQVDTATLTRSIRYAIGRTQAEEALRASTAQQRQQAKYLRTLIDLLPMYAWLKDTAGRYLSVNQATAAARGVSTDQMEGRRDEDFWPPELADAYRADDIQVMTLPGTQDRRGSAEWRPGRDLDRDLQGAGARRGRHGAGHGRRGARHQRAQGGGGRARGRPWPRPNGWRASAAPSWRR